MTTELEEDVITDTTDQTGIGLESKVILFNDNVHTFDDVASQMMKATGCSYEHGEEIAMEIHTKGKAVAYSGDISDCLRVSSILEEISLHTQIES